MKSFTTLGQMDKHKATIYTPVLMSQIPRLISQLDREQCSQSFGSFDREHWGWKFRDFPITMLQASFHPLALLWRFPFPDNPYYQNPQVRNWIIAAIENTCKRQHQNGSFDSVGPYTQDHGVSLAMVYILTEALIIMENVLTPTLHDKVAEIVRKGCQFALRSSEDYAFVNNHQALFAMAFLNSYRLFDDTKYHQRAEEIVDLIINRQSPEGWYLEYEGMDPGYESLGIFYLATYWKRTGSSLLFKSLKRSVEFFSNCVHPDGSVGGVYGSRHTSLYFPGGFEILSAEIPMAQSIAQFMRKRLSLNNVVTPMVSDVENLPSLAYTYLEACLTKAARYESEIPILPCEGLNGIRHFPKSNIVFIGSKRYYAVINASKGGVCRIFDKNTGKITYEDAGYLVQTAKRSWTSQYINMGQLVINRGENELTISTSLMQVQQELLTPLKFILLRILNLTLFRNLLVGSWIRRLIIKRLIMKKKPGPLHLNRSIKFGAADIRFLDRLDLTGKNEVKDIVLTRSFTAIHMGSAKYYHSSDLETIPLIKVDNMIQDLNLNGKAQCEFTIYFSDIPGITSVPVTGKSDVKNTLKEVIEKP